MKSRKLFFLVSLVALVFAWQSELYAEGYLNLYTTGKVVSYEEEKMISVLDDEGDTHSYLITPDTEKPDVIKEGMVVEVSSTHILAVKIEDLSQ